MTHAREVRWDRSSQRSAAGQLCSSAWLSHARLRIPAAALVEPKKERERQPVNQWDRSGPTAESVRTYCRARAAVPTLVSHMAEGSCLSSAMGFGEAYHACRSCFRSCASIPRWKQGAANKLACWRMGHRLCGLAPRAVGAFGTLNLVLNAIACGHHGGGCACK